MVVDVLLKVGEEGSRRMASLRPSFSRMVEEPLDGRDKVFHLKWLALLASSLPPSSAFTETNAKFARRWTDSWVKSA